MCYLVKFIYLTSVLTISYKVAHELDLSHYWCVNFDHLIKGVSVRFFHSKAIHCPFVINKHFVGIYFETMCLFIFSSNFYQLLSIDVFLTKLIITMMGIKWRFFKFCHFSTKINWHFTIRKSPPPHLELYIALDSWISFLVNGL